MNAPVLGKVRTSCQNCIFAVFDQNTQKDCIHGRTERFAKQGRLVPATDGTTNFDVVNGFCNYHRTAEWANTKTDINAALRRETDIVLGLVIYDTFEPDSHIETAIESVKALEYDHHRIKVVISSFVPRGVPYLMNKVEQLLREGFQCEAVMNISIFDKEAIDFDAFKKCVGCTHLGKMEHNSIIRPDMVKIVNRSLNKDLEKVMMFESDDICIMPFSVVNSEYLDHKDLHKMINHIRPLIQQHNAYVKV